MAKISIGLPCYNEEAFIEETLRSVLAQTETDFELIICDNASTDNTLEIVRRVTAGDPRVAIHSAEENLGAPANFERAFELASGPYFIWMGAHDLLDPDFLKKLRLVMDADPGCSLAFADSIFIAKDGSRIPGEETLIGPDLSSLDVVERLKSLIWTMRRCDIFYGLMRRDAINPRLVYQSRGPDMVILADLVMKGRCLRVPQLMFFRRKNRGDEDPATLQARLIAAGVLNSAETIAKSMQAVREAHLALLDDKGFSDSVRKQLHEVICQGFKDRHMVPWDATEAASGWERLQLKLASGDSKERVKQRIAQRVAASMRITDEDARRRLERELVSLLKDNHRLQKEVARLKKR